MRSKLRQQVNPVSGVKSQVVTLTAGAATLKGDAIAHVGDNGTLGECKTAVVCINAGVSGAAAFGFTPKVQESDTTTDGDFTDVTLVGGTLPVTASTTSASSFKYFYLNTAGLKKYFRIVLTAAGTTTDTCPVSMTVILGDGTVESLPRGTVPAVFAKA